MAILTVLDAAALAEFTAGYGLGEIKGSRGIEAGTVNTSYAVQLGAGRYFLRLYEEQDQAGAEAESRLLQHLVRAHVKTPAPFVARDGRTVRLLAGKPAALFPWVDGEMLCLKAVTPAAAREVGRTLARIHLAGPGQGSTLGPGRFGHEDLLQRCERIASSTDPAARAEADGLREALLAVAPHRDTALPRGLVHGDLFRDNVLWHEGKIAALIDFESAHLGPFAYDVAVTILSWSFREAFDLGVARAIIVGYREVRELEESERAGLFAEALFATLRFTITRITDDAARVGKKWQRFVARREALLQLGPSELREALEL